MQKERERFIDQKVKVNLNLNVGLASHKYDMTQKKKSTYFPGKI